MEVLRNYNLSKLNTFGISVKAKLFAQINDEVELSGLFASREFKENKKMFLGGGSNVLFTKDFDGIVILNHLKGIEIREEYKESVTIRACSGEIWHDLVTFAVSRGYWGIENLSLIPGTVGAAPMQNIGAYGAELKNVLENIEAYGLETGEKRIFSREECRLGYRDSIFKNELKDKYFISAITLKLSKQGVGNTSYKILRDHLEKNKIDHTNLKGISDAVVFIRESKLPNPKIIGNAGSFFKNVFVNDEKLNELRQKFPDIPHFEEDRVNKIPAGWLIEQTDWKGKRHGNAGVHEKHALVLVNHGGATGAEVLELAQKIILSVKEKFGLELQPEVNIV